MPAVGSRPATAGLLIALLSLASAAGGFAYAAFSSHLRGDTDQRANIALLALGLCTILIAVAPSLIFLALAVAACGIWFAPLNTMRTLILGKLLPASQLSEGFSTLSAAMQMGYGTSGIATGAILGIAGARACFIIAAAVTIASTLGAWLLHQHSKGSQAAQPTGRGLPRIALRTAADRKADDPAARSSGQRPNLAAQLETYR